MARLQQHNFQQLHQARKPVGWASIRRLLIIAFFMTSMVVPAGYLFIQPFRQIYWATAGRLNPSTTFKSTPSRRMSMQRGDPDDGGRRKRRKPESNLAEKYLLTKERAEEASKGPYGNLPVLVTWANYHYKDFVINWVQHVNATGNKNYLVGAMDDKLLKLLVDLSIPCFAMSSGLSLGDFGWGSQTFFKMGREKINLIQTFTRWGVEVLISDVDTVWMKDPVPYLQQYPDADVLSSSDHLTATYSDGGLETPMAAHSAANIGVMLFRPTAAELADEWVDMLDADEKLWDQNAFNELMRRGSEISIRDDAHGKSRLFRGYDSKLKFGILPVATFCSGHTYFVQRLHETLKLEPYVVHATFQFSGTPGKRNRFRESLLWNDPPAYFRHGLGFISVASPVPQALLDASRDVERNGSIQSTMPHFDLVNHQLQTVRALLGMATVLGRAAVLPQLYCGMDRWWGPHKGIIPGSNFELPFPCPADHVLDLEAMSYHWDKDYGPDIEWRESSFLDNPRAAELKKLTLTVRICGADTPLPEGATCSEGHTAADVQDGVVWIKPGLNDAQLKVAVGGDTKAAWRVLHFEDAAAWGGFTKPEVQQQFKRRLDTYGSLWCCVNRDPGHVWYDFMWDTTHKDRHDREMEEGKWEPLTGP